MGLPVRVESQFLLKLGKGGKVDWGDREKQGDPEGVTGTETGLSSSVPPTPGSVHTLLHPAYIPSHGVTEGFLHTKDKFPFL